LINKNRIIACFFTFLVTILISLSFSFSGNAQSFPDGLIGLSRETPAVLYSINASNRIATPIVTLNGGSSITGLSYLQGTLYGTDLFEFPGSMSDEDIGLIIARSGTITLLGDQNGSFNWYGLASDDCGGGAFYTRSIVTITIYSQHSSRTAQWRQ